MRPLGEILLQMGCLDAPRLQHALLTQRSQGVPLGRALVQDRVCSEEEVTRALSLQSGLPPIDFDPASLDVALGGLLPARFAKERRVVPLRLQRNRHEVLHVAMAGPAPLTLIDETRAASGKARVAAYLASDSTILRALARMYGPRFVDSLPTQPPVWLYGVSHVEAARVARRLAELGIHAQFGSAAQVLSARPEAVVVATLSALQGLGDAGAKLSATPVVMGEHPENELEAARALGAKGFLLAPADADLLARMLRRFFPANA